MAYEMHFAAIVKFNEEISKAEKRTLGRTDANDTPLEVHGRMKLTKGFKEHVREQIGKALGHNATLVERAEVWFDDINGPRGGVDTLCRVTLVLGGLPNLHVEERGSEVSEALDLLVPRLSRALKKTAERHGRSAPKATGARKGKGKADKLMEPDTASSNDVSLAGQDTGPTKKASTAGSKRLQKQSGDAEMKDSSPADGDNSGSRNLKRSDAGMVSALEDSVGRPSRKSTRGSSNAIKAATPLTSRQTSRTATPAARNARGK